MSFSQSGGTKSGGCALVRDNGTNAIFFLPIHAMASSLHERFLLETPCQRLTREPAALPRRDARCRTVACEPFVLPARYRTPSGGKLRQIEIRRREKQLSRFE